jgi:hypothetical protein
MQKAKFFLFPLFLSLACLPLLSVTASKVQATETSPLLLFFSGNVHGETEACG